MRSENRQLVAEHHPEAIVVSCIDWRFRDNITDAALTKAVFVSFGVERFFEIRMAGGAKNIASPDRPGRLETILDDLRLALKKGIKKIILLNHGNHCAKYAEDKYDFTDPDTERVFHEKELRLAGDILFSHFPEAEILLGYAFLDKDDKVVIDRIRHSTAS